MYKVRITDKSAVDMFGMVTYTFAIMLDDVDVGTGLTVTDYPETVQQAIKPIFDAWVERYELSLALPKVGDILEY